MNVIKTKDNKFNIITLFLFISCFWLLTGCNEKTTTCNADSIDTLHTCRVGVQVGTTSDTGITDLFKEKDAESMLERFNTNPDAITALKQQKIDVVVVDEQPALEFVRQNPELRILENPFAEETYAGVVALGNTKLLNEINAALDKLTQDGTVQKLKDTFINRTGNYHYTPVQDGTDYIVMATNAQFPPYEYYENNEVVGYEVELAYAIADILGKKLKIEDMEFDAVISAVSTGKADFGFSGFSETEERKKSIHFTNQLITTKISIIVNSNKNAVQSLSFMDKVHTNFIQDSRWKYIVDGLGITLIVAFFSTIIGIVGGFIFAVIRVTHIRTKKLKFLNFIVKIYINIIRGTPVMIQLLIIYYIVFAAVDVSKVIVAIAAFGLNSIAYTAEVIRSGILSVDAGQFEAGRSLGLTNFQIFRNIILPQATKNVLPALANESISLLKETSISGYIGLVDLTRGGVIIRSITYEAFMPLMAVALVYLVIIGLMSYGVSILEKRLKKNER